MENRNLYTKTFPRILFIFDVFLFIIAFLIAHILRFNIMPSDLLLNFEFLILLFIQLFIAYAFNVYQVFEKDLNLKIFSRFLVCQIAVTVSIFLIIFIFLRYETGIYGRVVLSMGIIIYTLPAFIIRLVLYYISIKSVKNLCTLFISGKTGAEKFVFEANNNNPKLSFKILLPSESYKKKYEKFINKKQIAGTINDLDKILKKSWSSIVFGIKSELSAESIKNLLKKRLNGIRVYELSEFYEINWQKIPIHYLNDNWFVFSQGFYLLHNKISLRLKYISDKILAFILLLLTFPLSFFILILIRLESRGNAIYKQKRIGLNGKNFTLYKFRSMYINSETNEAVWAKKDDERATKIGKILRLTRMDEIPQLVNVLKGDMSFVGPRPERPEFFKLLEKNIPFYRLRHIVKPGLTGWAQVKYSYASSIDDTEKKLEYDIYYIKHCSFFLDAEIILKTIRVVLFSRGR
ncbi:MAG: sugar transferase [Spirochaetia bacterium]|nr:sugar transferase [Spirochaetia bacterium]